jgi:hypothetical protein
MKRHPSLARHVNSGPPRTSEIVDAAGAPLFITGNALTGLRGFCSNPVKCVLLNASYSETPARPISSLVDFVIGMSRPIGHVTASNFSPGFYDAIAAGRWFAGASGYGRNAISVGGIPERLTRTLIVRNRQHFNEPPSVVESERKREGVQVQKIGYALDSSIYELISVLDFRADVILSEMEPRLEV